MTLNGGYKSPPPKKILLEVMKASIRTSLRCVEPRVVSFQPSKALSFLFQIFLYPSPKQLPTFRLPPFIQQRPISMQAISLRPTFSKLARVIATQPTKLRPFTTSSPRPAAVVIANRRKDDEGNDMLIDITPRASNVSRHSPFDKVLRLRSPPLPSVVIRF